MSRPDPQQLNTLADLRQGIDSIDSQLITLLAERLNHVDRVVQIKARDGIAAAAPTRYAAVIESIRDRSDAAGFDPDIAETMWRAMIDALIAREQKILGLEGDDA